MDINEKLLGFISRSVSPFHAVKNASDALKSAGYTELCEGEKWTLTEGGKYFVTRNGSSLIAFAVPSAPKSFMIAAAHTDSPTFKIKEGAEKKSVGYLGVNTEKYGGMIMASWMDRPLSAAGRVMVRTERGLETRLADLGGAVFIIPSVAIHMNRKCNENASYNPAVDMQPIYGLEGGKTYRALLAENVGAAEEDVISSDMFLYCAGGAVVGTDGQLICSPRLDDLQCAFSLLEGFLTASDPRSCPVLCLFDNEEVGSSTKQGAASRFLSDTLLRISEAFGMSYGDLCTALSDSFMVSADNAHAIHPNHPEYADRDNYPVINGGIVIKQNANQRYTTDAVSQAVFSEICVKAGAKYQFFANRSDMAGGSTLGNISNTQVALDTVDIGLPQLSMHSALETAGASDTEQMIKAMTLFFSSALKKENGSIMFF